MRRNRIVVASLAGVIALGAIAIGSYSFNLASTARAADNKKSTKKDTTKVDQAALKRARDEVKMLDDLYKTAIVGINDTYVNQQADIPAALIAGKVFEVMKKKGYHEARLIDITGNPKSEHSFPKTPFEKTAVKELNAGKAYYEEVGEQDGKPVLRVVTAVPAVNKICASCHRLKVGDKLGGVVYVLPIK